MVLFLQRWDGNVFFSQGTIAINGFSIVLPPLDHHHWMFFGCLTIAINGFSIVFLYFYHCFQWFLVVKDHWSNDAMVSMDRRARVVYMTERTHVPRRPCYWGKLAFVCTCRMLWAQVSSVANQCLITVGKHQKVSFRTDFLKIICLLTILKYLELNSPVYM